MEACLETAAQAQLHQSGFGAGSQLEYQVVPALGYQLTKRFTLQAGYRYLNVDYRSGGFKYDVRMSGLLLGATIRFK